MWEEEEEKEEDRGKEEGPKARVLDAVGRAVVERASGLAIASNADADIRADDEYEDEGGSGDGAGVLVDGSVTADTGSRRGRLEKNVNSDDVLALMFLLLSW